MCQRSFSATNIIGNDYDLAGQCIFNELTIMELTIRAISIVSGIALSVFNNNNNNNFVYQGTFDSLNNIVGSNNSFIDRITLNIPTSSSIINNNDQNLHWNLFNIIFKIVSNSNVNSLSDKMGSTSIYQLQL